MRRWVMVEQLALQMVKRDGPQSREKVKRWLYGAVERDTIVQILRKGADSSRPAWFTAMMQEVVVDSDS